MKKNRTENKRQAKHRKWSDMYAIGVTQGKSKKVELK